MFELHLRDQRGQERVFQRFPLVLGRRSDCDYRIDDPGVSRRHCAIALEDNAVRLTDLASLNGTYVNGARVEQVQTLHSGDEIKLNDVPLAVSLTLREQP